MTPHPQAEILRAIADGHTEFEIKTNNGWVKTNDVLLQISSGFEVRIAQPNTITITGTLTIPEPMRERPKNGERYWFLQDGCVATYEWDDDNDVHEDRFFASIWDTEVKAQKAADAWLKFVNGVRNELPLL